MSRLSCAVVRSHAELEKLHSEWNLLAAAGATPLLDHDWFASCAATLCDQVDLRIVTARDRGDLVGVAPMAIDRTQGRRLTVLGATTLHEPGGWLFSSDAAFKALALAVAALGERAVLQRVPAESPLAMLPRHLRGRAVCVVRPSTPCYGIDLDAGRSGRLSSSRARQLRVARERAEQAHGSVSVERLSPGGDDAQNWLSAVLETEGSGWKGRNGSSLSSRPRLLAFFRDYCRRASANGSLRVAVLRFGGEIAAVEMSVESHRRVWQLKIGYDERFAALMPGILLIDASIEAARSRGLAGYEFLGEAESWQERWHPNSRQYSLVAIYPFSIRGGLGAVTDLLSRVSRRPDSSQQESERTTSL